MVLGGLREFAPRGGVCGVCPPPKGRRGGGGEEVPRRLVTPKGVGGFVWLCVVFYTMSLAFENAQILIRAALS